MPEDAAYPMVSVEQARERILARAAICGAEEIPLTQALGRVLAEDVDSDVDIPPFANSAMDGYAFRADDLRAVEGAPRLRLVGSVSAGHRRGLPLGTGEAVRVMTGAPIPPGADTVVRFEETRLEGGDTILLERLPTPGRDVRQAGEDVARGQRVLASGALLRPQEIGMLAALGRAAVAVVRRPRVAILSTGDEVVPLGRPLGPGQIRDSNGYSLCAQVLEAGGEPLLLDIAPDRETALVARLGQALSAGADLVVTSGGVSVGDFDLTKQVLAAQGQIDFWWVNMRPGRPLAFGTLRRDEAAAPVPLLALPGNPVSAMLAFLLFGRPAVRKMGGRVPWLDLTRTRARLRDGVSRKDGRRHYLRVRLVDAPTGPEAILTGDQGSGILLSMVRADGLAVIPEDRPALAPGEVVDVLLFPSSRGCGGSS